MFGRRSASVKITHCIMGRNKQKPDNYCNTINLKTVCLRCIHRNSTQLNIAVIQEYSHVYANSLYKRNANNSLCYQIDVNNFLIIFPLNCYHKYRICAKSIYNVLALVSLYVTE